MAVEIPVRGSKRNHFIKPGESIDGQTEIRADHRFEELTELFASAENLDGSWTIFDQRELAANEVGDRVSE